MTNDLTASAPAAVADPLDIAYLAIGANTAWGELDDSHRRFEGQLDFVSEVIGHASMLTLLADELGEDIQVVWAYEVAEELGVEIGRALLSGKKFDAKAMAERLVASAS